MPVVAFILVGVLIVLYLIPSSKAKTNDGEDLLAAAILTALVFHGVITIAQKEEWSELTLEELKIEMTHSLGISQEFNEFIEPFLSDTPDLLLTGSYYDGFHLFDG